MDEHVGSCPARAASHPGGVCYCTPSALAKLRLSGVDSALDSSADLVGEMERWLENNWPGDAYGSPSTSPRSLPRSTDGVVLSVYVGRVEAQGGPRKETLRWRAPSSNSSVSSMCTRAKLLLSMDDRISVTWDIVLFYMAFYAMRRGIDLPFILGSHVLWSPSSSEGFTSKFTSVKHFER